MTPASPTLCIELTGIPRPQSDDQVLKNKLAEQEAKERAKTFLKNIGKRGAEGQPGSNEGSPAPPSGDTGKSKRRKRNSAK